ncbi:hypothetical protein JCM11251_000181 [Rhodosporidiobolus azoricus]
MAALPPGIKNWHWRTKGVETWAKGYWQEQLTGVEADGVVVDEVTDVEGDCELGMRKSKLVTIYDMRLTTRWKATDSAGEEVTGNLVAPEVAHDMDEDEYRFEASLVSGSGPEADRFLLTAKKALANKLRSKFQQFPKDMIAHHGKDLLADAAADSPSGSGASTPSTSATPAPSSTPAASTAAAKPAAKPAALNTATVRATGEFQCDAATLYDFLTRADKVPMWSRNPAQIEANEGEEVVLFGGNIKGKVLKAEAPKLFVMSWRAPTWPEDHYGQLETTLEQGSNSTTLNLKLSGVPIGKEDEAESNLHAYYIRGLQSIGLGLISSSTDSTLSSPSSIKSSPSRHSPQQRRQKKSSALNRWTLANAATFATSLGLIAALGAAFYYGPSGPGGKKA